MKPLTTHITRSLILLGVLATVITGVACSKKKQSVQASAPPLASTSGAVLRPASLVTTASVAPAAMERPSVEVKPAYEPITFRSRDYGLQFVYPWQYAKVSARALADDTAREDGQFSLVRIEVPKGFYPDTNFDSGYFLVSLNEDFDEKQCLALVAPREGASVKSEEINGVNFSWMEEETGGRGSSAKVRKYVAFSNATCYQIELGMTTRNEQGLSREVDPDLVFRRLDGILRTVKILPGVQTVADANQE